MIAAGAVKEVRLVSGDCYWYSPQANGEALITQCETSATELLVPAELDGRLVAGVGEAAFSHLFTLKRVVLPQGLRSIGASAFKSCVALREVVLPDSLCSVGAQAFRATALKHLRIPAACVEVADDSFCLQGSWTSPPSTIRPSTLTAIEVDPGNSELCLQGGLLCRRRQGGGLKVVLCARECESIVMTGTIAEVLPAAFTGVNRADTVRIAQRVRASGREVVFPDTACKTLVVECVDGEELTFLMPSDDVARKTLAKLFRAKAVDVNQAAKAFDGALVEQHDKLALSKAMLERLASGRCLAPDVARLFRARIDSVLEGVCLNFGSSSYWRGFDQLFECELLNEGNVVHVIDVLTRFDDAAAAGYLLQAKRQRFGKAAWDYGI